MAIKSIQVLKSILANFSRRQPPPEQFSKGLRPLAWAGGVDRDFEIIGEALSQASRFFPRVAGRVTDEQQVIAFRNRLIHGYATVRHALVWDIVQTKLPKLKEEVAKML
ncbi:MAG TPA: HepT-like ribonuclease domain-containing protein [Candidatus Methylomirabilis sp.]|nr:HepT-like ribonuclease domain-containing protein [Candidatus Methylomirabilis sp.]